MPSTEFRVNRDTRKTLQAYQCNNSIRTKTPTKQTVNDIMGEQREKNERLKRVNHLTNYRRTSETVRAKKKNRRNRSSAFSGGIWKRGESPSNDDSFFRCRRSFHDGHTVRTFGHGRREKDGRGRMPPFERHNIIIVVAIGREGAQAHRAGGRTDGRRERRT